MNVKPRKTKQSGHITDIDLQFRARRDERGLIDTLVKKPKPLLYSVENVNYVPDFGEKVWINNDWYTVITKQVRFFPSKTQVIMEVEVE